MKTRHNIHDPACLPGWQGYARIAKRVKYQGMTAEEMCRAMDMKELERNARRGGVAAIAEVERRMAESIQHEKELI